MTSRAMRGARDDEGRRDSDVVWESLPLEVSVLLESSEKQFLKIWLSQDEHLFHQEVVPKDMVPDNR